MNHDPSLESLVFGEGQIKLLRVASEIVGGDEALARQLDIRPSLLANLMSGRHKLPAPLVIQVIDIISKEHEAGPPRAGTSRANATHREPRG